MEHIKKYFKDYVKLFLLMCFVLFLFRKPLIYPSILTVFNAEKITGYVINEKNFERESHLTNRYTYSYEFLYKNKTYTNNSNARDLNVGDTLTIEFNKYFPFINRISK